MELIFALLHAAVAIALGVFHVWFWVQRGFWLPRYIHVLAFVSAVPIAAIMVVTALQGGGSFGALGFLWLLFFPAIVYGTFIFYGGVLAAPEPEEEAEKTQSLQQKNPFSDVK